MTESTPEARRAKMLADWQAAVDDQAAWLADPEVYWTSLVEQAKEARREGVIDADDLREQLELADAAYSWAAEELITLELNQ